MSNPDLPPARVVGLVTKQARCRTCGRAVFLSSTPRIGGERWGLVVEHRDDGTHRPFIVTSRGKRIERAGDPMREQLSLALPRPS